MQFGALRAATTTVTVPARLSPGRLSRLSRTGALAQRRPAGRSRPPVYGPLAQSTLCGPTVRARLSAETLRAGLVERARDGVLFKKI